MCQLQIMKSICRPSTKNQNARNAKHSNFLRICKCRKCQYGQCREYWWQWPRRRSIKRISTSFSLSRSPQDDVSVKVVGSFRLHLGQACLKDVIVHCIHVFILSFSTLHFKYPKTLSCHLFWSTYQFWVLEEKTYTWVKLNQSKFTG